MKQEKDFQNLKHLIEEKNKEIEKLKLNYSSTNKSGLLIEKDQEISIKQLK